MIRIFLGLALALAGSASASAATSPCGGSAPVAGVEIRGPVLHVLDGRTLCVALGADPANWTQITLEDAPASASWGALMSVAFGKDIICTVSDDARIAACRIDGRPVGPRLGEPRVAEAGLAWRAHAAPAPQPLPQTRVLRIATAGS